MPRFFIDRDCAADETLRIVGEDAHHISAVLRKRPGEKLTVCDFFNTEYLCEILSASNDEVVLTVLESRPVQSEPPFPITLCMALPKGDKMEWIIQKSVELGVTEILPFSSANTVMKLDEKAAEKKCERWRKIAKSAAEQCGRGRVPEVRLPVTYKKAVAEISSRGGEAFICYEGEDKLSLKDYFSHLESPAGLSFFVGAEGGFDQTEVALANAVGIRSVSLGKRILRCETAPLLVLSDVSFFFEL